ncbi:hypothetical protein [Halobacillus sp. Nhm2S1]|uniref:YobI family P-loop NTPase n=1 Tax=Halobacillus sp. Nhm2S1 TaxID=2866716 RepID=UPI001C736D60|nr:hypothetical protein [Halobacillus sp. Nhm2S1]MBX0358953.1 hypothetical protein [Halobacillus sp. Nhm2S1]
MWKLLQFNSTKEDNKGVIAEQPFENLTPSEDGNEDGQYVKNLNWALNDDEIKNIALTGPYGSGKSSILKTFISKSQLNFLHISLATFKNKEGDEKELEKSILQQMFYRVKSSKIPFSRFKRINHTSRKLVTFYTLLLITFILSMFALLTPKGIESFYKSTYIETVISNPSFLKIISLFALIAFVGFCTFFFATSFYSIIKSNVNLSKLTFANTTLEMNNSSEEFSAFDKYIDEIIYYFEVTNYNVVIFEDLDRFNNIEIFERLRELNALINNSENIRRKITFIYAVKDDIFALEGSSLESKNRTKFFDFIIPVIPVITSSNSREVFKKKLSNSSLGDGVTSDFLNDVTIYIDDMRILKNILNEFFIYKEKLNQIDLISNNLLAMIIYKNIYPEDYANLLFNKGWVYSVFNKKQLIIKERISRLDNEINKIAKDLSNSETENLETIEELQIAYFVALGIYRQNTSYNKKVIKIDNTTIDSWDPHFFSKLKKAKNIQYNFGRGMESATIEEISTVFGKKKDYFKREHYITIKEEEKLKDLRDQLNQLRKEKEEVKALSLKDIIQMNDESYIKESIFTEEIFSKKLLVNLIRNGYIDELYSQYINYFYSGSITTEDMKFIMSVKDRESLPYRFNLTNIPSILERLNTNDFKNKVILNFDLMNFLIKHVRQYELSFQTIITQLSDESETSIDFINQYRFHIENNEVFYNNLTEHWPRMWDYLYESSALSHEALEDILGDIIKYVTLNNIEALNKNNTLTSVLSAKENILDLDLDTSQNGLSKILNVLYTLNVKFKSIQLYSEVEELFDFIYRNNLFEINEKNLLTITKSEVLSLDQLQNAEHKSLYNYIKENIIKYIKEIAQKGHIKHETQDNIIMLLNDEEIEFNLKSKIISQINIRIENIRDINEVELWDVLFNEMKIAADWSNIIAYSYEYGKIDNIIGNYLNNKENCFSLSKINLENYFEEFEEQTVFYVSESIAKNTRISEDNFLMLLPSLIPSEGYDLDEIHQARIENLIREQLLPLTQNVAESLKEKHHDLYLILLQYNFTEFVVNQDLYEINLDDANAILSNNLLSKDNKKELIDSLDVEIIQNSNLSTTSNFVNHVLVYSKTPPNEIWISLLCTDININQKIRILSEQIYTINKDTISSSLKLLGYPFSDIAVKGKAPKIDRNKFVDDLLNKLKEVDYISSLTKKAKYVRVNTKRA